MKSWYNLDDCFRAWYDCDMKIEKRVVIEEGDEVWLLMRSKPNKLIARAVGVNENAMSHWKHGRSSMPWDVYVRLMKFFGVEVNGDN